MTVYLHVGSHKTGTGSIQKTMDKSREALRHRGLYYPENALGIWFDRSMKSSGHHYLAHALRKEGTIIPFIEPMREAAQGLDIFISSEVFGTLSARLRNILISELECAFDELKIILYLREPVSLITAKINMRARQGIATLRELLDNPPTYHYRREIRLWESIHGAPILVRKFERQSLINGDVIDDILFLLGFESALPELSRVVANRSVSKTALEAQSAVTEHLRSIGVTSPGSRRRYWRQQRQANLEQPGSGQQRLRLDEIEGPPFVLPADLAKRIRHAHRADVEWLARERGIHFKGWDTETLGSLTSSAAL